MAGWNRAWLMDKMKIRLCVFTLPLTSTFSCINCKQTVWGEEEKKKKAVWIPWRKIRSEARLSTPVQTACCPQNAELLSLHPAEPKSEKSQRGTDSQVLGRLSVLTTCVYYLHGRASYKGSGFPASAAHRRRPVAQIQAVFLNKHFLPT